MERYLVIWCPDLLEQKEQGREQRAFFRVVEAVSSLATRIETVRPGVCAVPTRGPSRYFGGDLSLCRRGGRAGSASAVPGTLAGVGVADGLFAAVLAARSLPQLPSGTTTPAGWQVLRRPSGRDSRLPLPLARRRPRAGRAHGSAAPARDPDPGPVRCPALQARSRPVRHRRCRLPSGGNRSLGGAAGSPVSSPGRRTASADPQKKAPVVRQPGFWGGTAESDKRAAAVLARIQSDLGPEEVLSARLQGGRDPSERACLRPCRQPDRRNLADARARASPGPAGPPAASGRDRGPAACLRLRRQWCSPGRCRSPSRTPLELRFVVSARVLLSSAPARVSVAGGPLAEVARWAGPWPADDRWWSPGHRRRARVQVVTASGAAQLLVAEGGGWWLEGVYD